MSRNDPLSLTPLQEKAINLLITGKSVVATSTELKIGRKTLFRWLNNPIFKEELEARQREISQAVTIRLQSLATKSIDKLEALLDSNDPNVVFKVASLVLTRIPVQNDESNTLPFWEKELKKEAESMAKIELDKLYMDDYGNYEGYLRLNKSVDMLSIRRKRIELEQNIFEQLKKEKLADL
jgi:DNA polymerase III delta prime subunit